MTVPETHAQAANRIADIFDSGSGFAYWAGVLGAELRAILDRGVNDRTAELVDEFDAWTRDPKGAGA